MSRRLFTQTFWADAAERAIKTAAQVAVLAVGQGVTVDLFSADWHTVAGLAAGGAALSLLSSIASVRAPGMSPASVVPPGL